MGDKWIVHEKHVMLSQTLDPTDEDFGEEDGIAEYEICAIKKNNKHGKKSWGWYSSDEKIVLFGSGEHTPLPGYDCVGKEAWAWALDITQKFCDLLNSSETGKENRL